MSQSPIDIIQYPRLFGVLDEFVEECRQHNWEFALLLVEISKFREINLVHGYQAGDKILEEFCGRLQQVAREQDLVLRTGNSEFLFFIRKVHNEGHAALAALKILQTLEKPFATGEHGQLKVNANIGGAICPDHGQDSETLLKSTQSALIDSRSKLESYCIFNTGQRPEDMTSWDVESSLEMAIERDELELYFQPQVELDSGRVCGAEALLRWNHSQRGIIEPGFFIPIAEQGKLIDQITDWSLRSTLWLANEWPQFDEPLAVSVNLSPKMIEHGGLTETITDMSNIFGVSLEYLTLEITESVLMEQVSHTVQALTELKELGISISIDDFGTGYSSMSYFRTLPASQLKIDRSFVANMMDDPIDLHIVRTITDMAQGFGLKVVAEGIESRAEFDMLASLGCDIGQGFYICQPLPHEQFIEWLNQYNAAINHLSSVSG